MELKWYYLSFVLPNDKWAGATCVEARDQKESIKIAWERHVNPGGEVLIIECDVPPPEGARYKLMNLATVKKLFGPVIRAEV